MSDLGAARGRIIIDTSDLRRAQQEVANASRAMTAVLSTVGVGAGALGIRQLAQFVAETEELTTAYNRQRVAAENLAGSQDQLNQFLVVYDKATGGALDKATQLANVTKLMSVGFADSAEELDQFARAIRGISVAVGKSQDFVTQNLILEMFSQRGMRLDQLGLQYDKVRQRSEQLQAADRSLTRQTAYQMAVLEQAEQRFGALAKSAEGGATNVEDLTATLKDLRLELGQISHGPVNFVAKAMTNWLRDAQRDASILLDIFRQIGQSLDNTGRLFPQDMSQFGTAPWGTRGAPPRSRTPAVEDFTERNAAITDYFADVARIERDAANDRLDATRQYEQQRTSLISDYEQTIARDAQDFAISRTRQEQQFQLQINRIAVDGHKREVEAAQDLADSIARLRADAGRQEARRQRDLDNSLAAARQDSASRIADAERDHNDRLNDAREDSAERLAEQQQELDERLSEGRADSLKRIGEIEAEYQRNREQAATAHRDTLLDAAARLDAKAVWQEQRRFAREEDERLAAHNEAITKERERLAEFEAEQQAAHTKAVAEEKARLQEFIDEANEAHQKRLDDERDNLKERIDQEKEAHAQRVADAKEALDLQIADQIAANAERLEEARLADAQRLADMKFAHGEQQRQEDEDRGLRLSRLTEDHNKQLTEMDRLHGERIKQIGEQEAEQLQDRQDAFLLQLNDLGLYHTEWLNKQKKLEEDALKLFDAWWKEIQKRFRITPDNLPPVEWPNGLGPKHNNPFEVPGGGDSPSVSAAFLPMPNETSSFIMPQPRGAAAGGAGAGGVSIGSISFSIAGVTGQTAQELYTIIDQRILDTVRRAAGRA